MKLAFTTLGCPKWELDTIISKAVEYGYAGVDFRVLKVKWKYIICQSFQLIWKIRKKNFREASLEIPCFSSSVRLFTTSESELDGFLEELKQYARLCNEFNTPYIRVFGGKIGETSREDAVNIVADNLQKMLEIVEEHQVTLLLETHDDWTNCEYVEDVFNSG